MPKYTLTFERITHETSTIQVELTDDVTARMVQGWAEWGIGGRSPLDQQADELKATRTRQEGKWVLVMADPALAAEAEPQPRTRRRRTQVA